ncbi:hypothetical protein [Laspinema olomoucense]|uniref:hypothetical protein n=1 Tax=Laspinema olomoucense TaxID=3231600 RepID=UPI0021BB6AE4|nr:hypothetical protein [Laspinema sp. D3c]MCT7994084.1 hypothetical protein [Laspinema sp. D3c]
MIRSIIDRPWGTSGASGEAIAHQDGSLSSGNLRPSRNYDHFFNFVNDTDREFLANFSQSSYVRDRSLNLLNL